MNRSILIVICDFLLVSMLAFSSVDINNVSENGVAQTTKSDATATNQPESGGDLTAVMRQALEEERRNREQLQGELSKARQAVSQRDQQVENFQQQLQSKDQEARQLEQERANLQQKFAAAQTNLQSLNQQLQATTTEAVMSKEQLAALQDESRKRTEEAAALQAQLAQLARSNQAVLAEKQQLTTQLQVAEVEKRSAVEQAARMQDEVKVEREEKARLAEGVKALASKSGELAKEIQENRTLTPNTIFTEFLTNRVQARFLASRSNVLGMDASKHKETETVLVSDGTNIFALCHVQETPLTLWVPGTEWEGLTGTLNHDTAEVPIRSLSFFWPDPHVVLIPITAADARQLGSKVYRISPNPYKFQDAVLVGAREGYYGQCKFQVDESTPQYVKLDRSVLKGLFGQFNPSRGDLVFSQTGELLGVMANSTYCMMIRNFDASATVQFGSDVRTQHTGETLSRLYTFVSGLPFRLQ